MPHWYHLGEMPSASFVVCGPGLNHLVCAFLSLCLLSPRAKIWKSSCVLQALVNTEKECYICHCQNNVNNCDRDSLPVVFFHEFDHKSGFFKPSEFIYPDGDEMICTVNIYRIFSQARSLACGMSRIPNYFTYRMSSAVSEFHERLEIVKWTLIEVCQVLNVWDLWYTPGRRQPISLYVKRTLIFWTPT